MLSRVRGWYYVHECEPYFIVPILLGFFALLVLRLTLSPLGPTLV